MTIRERIQRIVLREDTHSTHAEDEILHGAEGFNRLIRFYSQTLELLEGHTDGSEPAPSVKIDGAPAIFVSTSFDGVDGGPFVATKGLFNKNPITYKSQDDIDGSDKPDGLKKKLSAALELAKTNIVPEGEVWQGDMLWSTGDAKEFEDYVYVKPNTLVYAAPKGSDIAEKMKTTKIGVVFHTRYRGSIDSPKQTNDVKVEELKKVPDWAYVIDARVPDLSGKASFTSDETKYMEENLALLKNYRDRLVNDPDYKQLCSNSDFIQFTVMTCQNNMVDRQIDIDPRQFVQELVDWAKVRADKEMLGVEKLKTEKGRIEKSQRITASMMNLQDVIRNNKTVLTIIAEALVLATEFKADLMEKMETASRFVTMVEKRAGGFEKTGGEGFVVSDVDGNFVKLVDRKSFSYFNRSPDVVKGWDNPSGGKIAESCIVESFLDHLQENAGGYFSVKISKETSLEEIKDEILSFISSFLIQKNKNKSMAKILTEETRDTVFKEIFSATTELKNNLSETNQNEIYYAWWPKSPNPHVIRLQADIGSTALFQFKNKSIEVPYHKEGRSETIKIGDTTFCLYGTRELKGRTSSMSSYQAESETHKEVNSPSFKIRLEKKLNMSFSKFDIIGVQSDNMPRGPLILKENPDKYTKQFVCEKTMWGSDELIILAPIGSNKKDIEEDVEDCMIVKKGDFSGFSYPIIPISVKETLKTGNGGMIGLKGDPRGRYSKILNSSDAFENMATLFNLQKEEVIKKYIKGILSDQNESYIDFPKTPANEAPPILKSIFNKMVGFSEGITVIYMNSNKEIYAAPLKINYDECVKEVLISPTLKSFLYVLNNNDRIRVHMVSRSSGKTLINDRIRNSKNKLKTASQFPPDSYNVDPSLPSKIVNYEKISN